MGQIRDDNVVVLGDGDHTIADSVAAGQGDGGDPGYRGGPGRHCADARSDHTYLEPRR